MTMGFGAMLSTVTMLNVMLMVFVASLGTIPAMFMGINLAVQMFLLTFALMTTTIQQVSLGCTAAISLMMAMMLLVLTNSTVQIAVILQSALAGAVSAVQGQAGAMMSAGINVMQGLRIGMESQRSSIIATARSIAAAVKSATAGVLNIHSPSKEMYKLGRYTGQGQALGMKSTIPEIQSTSQEMSGAVLDASYSPVQSAYSPESDAQNVNATSRSVESNTYAPQFNLTIGASEEDRVMERKVKLWIREALDDTFATMRSKSPRLREV